MLEASTLIAGSSLSPRTWTSISVPFPRALGCALVRSKYKSRIHFVQSPVGRYGFLPFSYLLLNTNPLFHDSIAFAEVTIVMAYLFHNFKLSLPPDFQRPKQKDLFTMEYGKPGLPVKFEAIN
jgi:hypothetical protein